MSDEPNTKERKTRARKGIAVSMTPWRNVQLMAGAGLEQTEEESEAWNLFAAIHRFACEQQTSDRGDPVNETQQ